MVFEGRAGWLPLRYGVTNFRFIFQRMSDYAFCVNHQSRSVLQMAEQFSLILKSNAEPLGEFPSEKNLRDLINVTAFRKSSKGEYIPADIPLEEQIEPHKEGLVIAELCAEMDVAKEMKSGQTHLALHITKLLLHTDLIYPNSVHDVFEGIMSAALNVFRDKTFDHEKHRWPCWGRYVVVLDVRNGAYQPPEAIIDRLCERHELETPRTRLRQFLMACEFPEERIEEPEKEDAPEELVKAPEKTLLNEVSKTNSLSVALPTPPSSDSEDVVASVQVPELSEKKKIIFLCTNELGRLRLNYMKRSTDGKQYPANFDPNANWKKNKRTLYGQPRPTLRRQNDRQSSRKWNQRRPPRPWYQRPRLALGCAVGCALLAIGIYLWRNVGWKGLLSGPGSGEKRRRIASKALRLPPRPPRQ